MSVPIQLVPSGHMGWGVDRTTAGNVCVVTSKDECRRARPSSKSGGFRYLGGIAADPRSGYLYVADSANNRIQKFTPQGVFVAMFGWHVNATKDRQAAAPQTETNICTATSRDMCTGGVVGTRAGQLASPSSIAVDPLTGDIYVLEVDASDYRVDKYTAGGRFVWMVGKDVNRRRKDNICTQREIKLSRVKCGAGGEAATDGGEQGAFKFFSNSGDLLAVGGPEDLLYVGEEHRVQEFEADGKWKREILLASISSEPYSVVSALAVDHKGDVYLVYRTPEAESGLRVERGNMVHKFGPNGEQIAEFPADAAEPNAPVKVDGIAVDTAGRLAVIGVGDRAGSPVHFGSLYDGNTGLLMTEFTPPSDFDGVAFNGEDDMYIAATDRQEVAAYAPAAGLLSSPVACGIGAIPKTFSAFNCGLNWEVGS